MNGMQLVARGTTLAASAVFSVALLAGPGATPAAAQTVTIKCESKHNRFAHCARKNIANVRLTRQLSNKPCFQGNSWGVDANGIWVNHGCRALFTADVVSSGGGSGGGHGSGNTGGRTFTHQGTPASGGGGGSGGTGGFGSGGGSNIVVTCRSTSGRWKFCNVNVPTSATMKRQISNRKCTKGLTWGFVADGIWTADGCSARFDVK